MKKRYLILIAILSLVIAMMSIPTIYADEVVNSISINEVTTSSKTIELYGERNKNIDMMKGQSVTIATDIIIKKDIFIDDETSIAPTYSSKNGLISIVDNGTVSSPNESGIAYIRRGNVTITADNVGVDQLVVSYKLHGKQYFDSININVVDKIESLELRANVTTLKTDEIVDFELVANGSNSLATDGEVTYSFDGEVVNSLKGYKLPSEKSTIDVVITHKVGDVVKEYKQSLSIMKAEALNFIETEKDEYGFMLKDEIAKIYLLVSKNSYPNIRVHSNSATLVDTKISNDDSVKEGYDRYELSIKLNRETYDEDLLITTDDNKHFTVAKLNVIDKITSVTIVSDNTKFESNKPSTFRVLINGVKDVNVPVKWTINGSEMTNETGNSITYKSITSTKVKIVANVGDAAPAEYSYEIDTSTNTIILTVVLSLVVIIICIPILIALKKNPKPNLKAMILKDNKGAIAMLEKLKELIDSSENKAVLKTILKINSNITRSEKRAQQESFEEENKSFGGALTALSNAKSTMNSLLSTYKSNSKEANLKLIDDIIVELERSNNTITLVEENM